MFKVCLIALVASLGGVVVLVGLWLEESGEKEWLVDISDFRKSKSKAHRGLKWVFWGVFIETLLGFALAMWEGAEAIKNAPLNQPIFDISAFVHIKVKGSNHVAIASFGTPRVAAILFSKTPQMAAMSAGILPSVESKEFEQSFPLYQEDTRQYSMRFHLDAVGASFFKNLGMAKTIEDVNALSIWLKFIPLDAEILEGSAKVMVNNNIEKDFKILPQKAFEPLILTNNPAYRDSFKIIAVAGTNTLPENRGPQKR